MLTSLAGIAIVTWVATAALFIADLRGAAQSTAELARLGIRLAIALTACVAITLVIDVGVDAFTQLEYAFMWLALLLGFGFLALRRESALRVVGALVAPSAAILLGIFVIVGSSEPAELDETGWILLTHVGLAVIGVGAFALASFLALLYIVQDSQLRARSFGPLFQRLPSLEELDAASLRMIAMGFVVFTVALVLGFVWSARVEGDSGQSLRIILSAITWLIFGIVLQMRVSRGWRGRSAAWLTVVGALSAVAVLGAYLIPRIGA